MTVGKRLRARRLRCRLLLKALERQDDTAARQVDRQLDNQLAIGTKPPQAASQASNGSQGEAGVAACPFGEHGGRRGR